MTRKISDETCVSISEVREFLDANKNNFPKWVEKDFKTLDFYKLVGMDPGKDLCLAEYEAAQKLHHPTLTHKQADKQFDALSKSVERFKEQKLLHALNPWADDLSEKESCNLFLSSAKVMNSHPGDFSVGGSLFCTGANFFKAVDLLLNPKNGHSEARGYTVKQLIQYIPAKLRAGYISKLLDDPNENVAWTAMAALKDVPACDHYPLLAKAMRDRRYSVKEEAIRQLRECNDQYPSIVFAGLHDKDPAVQGSALGAISYLGSTDEIEEALNQRQQNGAEPNIIEVNEAWATLPTNKLVPHLLHIFNNPNLHGEGETILAVDMIDRMKPGTQKIKESLYTEACRHPNPNIRKHALLAASEHVEDNTRRADLLWRGLTDEDSDVQIMAANRIYKAYEYSGTNAEYLNLLEMAMNHPNEGVRMDIAAQEVYGQSALSAIVHESGGKSYPYLERLLNDQSIAVRKTAIEFLVQYRQTQGITPDGARKILAIAEKNGSSEVRKLAKESEQNFPGKASASR